MDLGTTPYPEYTRDFLYAVPVVLFAVPALLYGMRLLADDSDSNAAGGPPEIRGENH